jgi:hypothetical protein
VKYFILFYDKYSSFVKGIHYICTFDDGTFFMLWHECILLKIPCSLLSTSADFILVEYLTIIYLFHNHIWIDLIKPSVQHVFRFSVSIVMFLFPKWITLSNSIDGKLLTNWWLMHILCFFCYKLFNLVN